MSSRNYHENITMARIVRLLTLTASKSGFDLLPTRGFA